jgi:Skp family chaperone for outer membrane proteins
VCVFDRLGAVAASQAGLSALQQLRQFTEGVRGELTAQRNDIVRDDQALAKLKGSMPEAQYDERLAQLRSRYADLDRLAAVRSDQLARTRDQATATIEAALQPALAGVIGAHRCSIVIEKRETYGVNAAMDITSDVVQSLNGRLATISLQLAAPAPPH